MQSIIPSDNRLNEETINLMLNEGNLKGLLLERAMIDKRKKEIDGLIKEKRQVLHELMSELEVDDLDLGDDFFIRNIRPFSRNKIISIVQLKKQYPELVDKLVSKVDVNGYIQIKTK